MLRSSGHFRAVAVALTVMWALAPLVSAFHSDEHAHRYCLEHLTFEESGSISVESSFSSDEAYSLAVADTAGSDDHVACSVAPLGSRFTSIELPRLATEVAGSAGATLSHQDTRAHPPIAHLDLAPKSSPPYAPAA
jgi:hypothetical protein